MNLHEYQAKGLFARHGIPVPRSLTVALASEARAATDELGGERWVVKAQVHSGARGKAGGVVLTDSLEQVERETERLVGTRLKTHQTGPEGLPIGQVLIETPTDSVRELYLGACWWIARPGAWSSWPRRTAAWISRRWRPRPRSAS
jgi:succinyl-CoA synthetase beta subunit